MKQVNGWYVLNHDKWFPMEIQKQWMMKMNRHLSVCMKYVKNKQLALDCGAHYGSWSKLMAKHFDRVVAIEGRSDIYQCLQENMKPIKNVEPQHALVGDENKQANIGVVKRWEGNDNSGVACITDDNTNEVINVLEQTPMITIDSLELDNVGFIKLDVEGYELFALQGAEQTLLKCKPVIIFEEMGPQCRYFNTNIGDIGLYLESLGATFVESANKHNHVFAWK